MSMEPVDPHNGKSAHEIAVEANCKRARTQSYEVKRASATFTKEDLEAILVAVEFFDSPVEGPCEYRRRCFELRDRIRMILGLPPALPLHP
jgi:hypothetical protein